MNRSTEIIAVAVFAAAAVGGAGVAVAAGGPEDAAEGPDVRVPGAALERAEEAAVTETGGGRVTGTEIGDAESYYEVEVTLEDGRQVDVQLDESFTVVRGPSDVVEADGGRA